MCSWTEHLTTKTKSLQDFNLKSLSAANAYCRAYCDSWLYKWAAKGPESSHVLFDIADSQQRTSLFTSKIRELIQKGITCAQYFEGQLAQCDKGEKKGTLRYHDMTELMAVVCTKCVQLDEDLMDLGVSLVEVLKDEAITAIHTATSFLDTLQQFVPQGQEGSQHPTFLKQSEYLAKFVTHQTNLILFLLDIGVRPEEFEGKPVPAHLSFEKSYLRQGLSSDSITVEASQCQNLTDHLRTSAAFLGAGQTTLMEWREVCFFFSLPPQRCCSNFWCTRSTIIFIHNSWLTAQK